MGLAYKIIGLGLICTSFVSTNSETPNTVDETIEQEAKQTVAYSESSSEVADEESFGMAPNPFHVPRGMKSGDTFGIYTEGRWHVFNLGGNFAHSSSNDLIYWKQHPDVTFGGATGSIVKHNEQYYIFYTAPGQAVSVAISKDLDIWTSVEKNPVVESDGKIYQHGNFRDPYVFYNEEDQCWWLLLGAREVGITGQRSGCVALAKSEDLLNWKLHKPLWAPRIGPHADCPQLFQHNGKWFLFYLQRFTRYRFADSSFGPWERGKRRNLDSRIAAAGSRPLFDGKRWISFPFMISLKSKDTLGEFGEWGSGGPWVVPRQWEFHQDNNITVRPPAEIFQAMHNAKPCGRLPLDNVKRLTGNWKISESKKSAVSKSESGGSLFVPDIPKNFYLEADVTFDKNNMDIRILFNLNEDLDLGYILSLMPDDDIAILRGTSYWDTNRELVTKPIELEPGSPIKIRMFRTGTIVDIFVDDKATVTHRLFQSSWSNIALEFVDGTGSFENLFICELPEVEL